ncbi:MAG: aminotransferase class V-fold PLP-dependent enzyme, partial [Myxococcales bacterium]|nr:aminotransferase class V-fold PLP-dependent enzyme [Myxococcales bacterium]
MAAGHPGEDDEKDLLSTRARFPALAGCVHLVSHSLGAMPARAREETARFHDDWERGSVGSWGERWLPAVRALGDVIASVLGVAADSVCILPNVSVAQAVVASCFDFSGPRRRVVYDDLNFSTVHYVWQAQARRGAEVVVVPGEDGIHPPTDALLAAIDERTLLVPISHALFRSSGLYDARRIIERAHAVGAMVLLDVYQSAGTVPLSLGEWGCDF